MNDSVFFLSRRLVSVNTECQNDVRLFFSLVTAVTMGVRRGEKRAFTSPWKLD